MTISKITSPIAYIIFFVVTYNQAHITNMNLKADDNKEIVESATTTSLYASTLLKCAAACSMSTNGCCALSYSNQKCRLDSSCWYSTQDNVDSKVLYLQDSIDDTTASVTTVPTQTTLASCEGCIPFGTSSYLFIPIAVSYVVAKADCQAKGGKLPEIETAEENTFLRNSFMTLFGQRSWLGAFNYAGSGNSPTDFQWNSRQGQQMLFTDWKNGEPNGGDCVIVTSNKNAYQWASQTCAGPYYYTCEFQ